MKEADILAFLLSTPLTSRLSEPLRSRVARIGELRTYKPRERIVSQGDPVWGIHAVRTGSVVLEVRGPGARDRVVYQLLPPQSFGTVPVLEDHATYPFDATATEWGTELLAFPKEAFLELFAAEDEVPRFMVSALSEKLMTVHERVHELSIISAGTRLARHLLERCGPSDTGPREIDLGLDKKDLAGMLAVTPEHLSRLLRRWGDAGLIESMGRSIWIRRPEVLRAVADLDPAPKTDSR